MCFACSPGMSSILHHAGSRRSFLSRSLALSGAALHGAAFGQSAGATLFQRGDIITMNPRQPTAEAIAVRGGRIIAVGRAADVAARAGPGARVVDLQGRTLLPGLIDPHMHTSFVAFDDWIDVGAIACPGFADVGRTIRTAAASAGPDTWVRAKLFDPSITRDAVIPDMAMLDRWSPNHPLIVVESNGHVAYANSRAFALAGVAPGTADPPLGRFGRDAKGAFNGRLEEMDAFMPFVARMPMPDAREMLVRVRRLFDQAASVGCTTLHDCGIGAQAGMGDVSILDAAMANSPPVRLRGMLVSTAFDAWEKAGLKPGRGDDLFRIDGIKAWADGSNQAKTGYQRENYLGTQSRGAMNYTPAQLTETIRRAHAGGWQVGVHANGDAAIDITLDAYEAVLKAAPRADHRHRIEHCSVLHPEQIARMQAAGLSPSFLIGHIRWWGKAFRDRILGPERARFYDPCASALAGKLRISLHSDWNVTPLQPLRYVEDAVARVMNEGGGVFFPEERIPVEAALRAVTLDAAWQCRMDDIAGSLEPGKYADLTILESNPLKTDPTRISRIRVSETWLGGERKFVA